VNPAVSVKKPTNRTKNRSSSNNRSDAKVCVRVASEGRQRAKSTVTTWGAVTNQVLALRDHLIAEQVTLVVMEATSDYWKTFYYLLEDRPFEVMLVNAAMSRTCRGARAMSPTRHGWHSSARMAWFVGRWSRLSRSASFGT